MPRISTLCSTILIVLAGCAMSPPAVTDSPNLSVLQKVFPGATALQDVTVPAPSQRATYADQTVVREIQGPSDVLGYCVDATVAAKSGPFRIRVLVDSDLTVVQARVVFYAWDRGRDVCRPQFTGQFEGKGPDAPLQVGQDIDGMTGATLSSRAMAGGVRDSLALVKTLL